MKQRNLRVVVLALIALTLIAAIYHLYYSGIPDPEPTNLVTSLGESGARSANGPGHRYIDDGGYRAGRPENGDNVNEDLEKTIRREDVEGELGGGRPQKLARGFNFTEQAHGLGRCKRMEAFIPEIDALKVYENLEFEGDWIRTREYWNPVYEKRYQSIKNNDLKKERARPDHNIESVPSLKVFVIPHSHNDPGWLKTFEGYFHAQTQQILDNAVEKMTEFKHMKFLWSEISFLSKWWEHAHPTKRTMFQKLVKEGRLEIVTGGWVMTDEATVNLYSMIDQLVEGHQWVKAHLGVVPKSSWSIDPFGHGSTFPFVLQASNIKGMVIQRIHFGWKKWFLDQRKGDFEWVQRWDNSKKHSIKCHNAPWDIYSIKHSCGPFPQICLNFDFKNISGEYSENYLISTPITSQNVKAKAELMLEQYGRTASVFTHNIAMISMGDDFRFHKAIEWDQQYTNYMKLFDYINANKEKYNAEVQFGTVSDYFDALEKRGYQFPTFSGDFHVYSDIFSEGRPAYWSGYYGTRPFWKKFYRETENVIRGAEILFTFAYSFTQQQNPVDPTSVKVLTHVYEGLTVARRWLGLFAHHDASTGTSKQEVMNDYGLKLLDAMQLATNSQASSLSTILFGHANNSIGMRTDYELDRFGALAKQLPIQSGPNPSSTVKKLVLYNSLGKKRLHLTKVVVTSPHVVIVGPSGDPVISQLNPVLELTESAMLISSMVYEVAFLAELAPLSVSVYEVRTSKPKDKWNAVRSVLYCKQCYNNDGVFEVNPMQTGDIQLNNERLQLLFDRNSGFLKKITKVDEQVSNDVSMSFGGYASIDFRSGAYLLMPDTNTEQEIPFKYVDAKLFILSGPLYSELSVSHAPLLLSTRILHTGGKLYEEAIFIQNQVDLGRHNGEIFIRFDTNIQSKSRLEHPDYTGSEQPSFFTDQAGFTFEKRVKIPKIRYEGNTYPVNTMAYVQDDSGSNGKSTRLTFFVDRTHGCSSMEIGRIECMIERRTIFDDSRGMGEGVTDNRPTVSNYVLLLEKLDLQNKEIPEYQRTLPTLSAHHLSQELNYPSFLYLYDEQKQEQDYSSKPTEPEVVSLVNQELPCDVFLINLRTLTDTSIDFDLNLPSRKALLIAQKLGYLCLSEEELKCTGGNRQFHHQTEFNGIYIKSIVQSGLTGVSSTTRGNLTHLHDIVAEPFEISSAILSF